MTQAAWPGRWLRGVHALLFALMVWGGQGMAVAHQAVHVVSTAQPIPLVVDSDMAADDWLALLYLLQRPEVAIEAITVTGAGETHCAPGIAHAASLVALSGHAPIPIACGPEQPLRGHQSFPESWRQAVDDFYGLRLPEGPNPTPDAQATDLLQAAIVAHPGALHILALGPLTNLAHLFQNQPALASQIARITIMGGAVTVPGNVKASLSGFDNETAEWNIFADPYAAEVVLQSGAPVTLVSLDATSQAPLTPEFYQRLAADHDTPSGQFVYALFTGHYDMFVGTGDAYTWYFWDPLAAATVAHPSLVDLQAFRLRVVQRAGPELGRTKPVRVGGHWVLVSVAVDAQRFEDDFLETLGGVPGKYTQ